MSTSAPEDTVPRPAPPSHDLARLRRTTTESPYGRHVAGVAGGLARHFDIDPLVVRIALVVAAILGGGILFYAAIWLLVPEDGKDQAPIHLDARTRTVLLWGAAAVAAAWLIGYPFGTHDWFPWPLVIMGVLVAVFANRRQRRRAWAPDPDPAESSGTSAAVSDATTVTPSYAAPRPRRSGPVWFGFALATIALGEGILGLMAAAGHHPNLGAYPALALAVIGGYLIVGAFWGRAGGLVALGIVAALATVVGTAANGVGQGRAFEYAPTSAAAVMPSYDLGTGSLTLDLTRVRDLKALDGRTIDVNGTVGRLIVIVPGGTGVNFHGTIRAAGSIQTWAGDHNGPLATFDQDFPSRNGLPTITLNASIRFGAIQLEKQQ